MPLILTATALGLIAAILAVSQWPRHRSPSAVSARSSSARPVSFGLSMSWIALRTRDTAAVLEALGLSGVHEADWRAGIAAIYDEEQEEQAVFVAPPVDGWTLVAGMALPHPIGRRFADPCLELLLALGRCFPEVQCFLTFPAVDLYGWARVARGRLERAFATGDDGLVWNAGAPSREERALGLDLPDASQTGDAPRGAAPTESQVIELARRWSLDPTVLGERDLPSGTGHLGLAPRKWRNHRLAPPAPRPATRAGSGRRPLLHAVD